MPYISYQHLRPINSFEKLYSIKNIAKFVVKRTLRNLLGKCERKNSYEILKSKYLSVVPLSLSLSSSLNKIAYYGFAIDHQVICMLIS